MDGEVKVLCVEWKNIMEERALSLQVSVTSTLPISKTYFLYTVNVSFPFLEIVVVTVRPTGSGCVDLKKGKTEGLTSFFLSVICRRAATVSMITTETL